MRESVRTAAKSHVAAALKSIKVHGFILSGGRLTRPLITNRERLDGKAHQ